MDITAAEVSASKKFQKSIVLKRPYVLPYRRSFYPKNFENVGPGYRDIRFVLQA
jgi:hypothetical protein